LCVLRCFRDIRNTHPASSTNITKAANCFMLFS
jgi:hypothetical protein